MIRPRLFELGDLPWIPRWWRDGMTDCLERLGAIVGSYRGALPHLERVLARTGRREIVDLGSGAGGPMLKLAAALGAGGKLSRVTCTDLFPNEGAVRRVASLSGRGVPEMRYFPSSVDMKHPPEGLSGVQTIFTGFHHLSREDAEHVLRSAAERGEPLAIFETTGRGLPHFLMVLAVPPAIVLLTPFLFPLQLRRIVATYLVPLIPLGCLWDGLVSNWRTYSVGELREMASRVRAEGYRFEAGTFSAGPLIKGTYLLGFPERSS